MTCTIALFFRADLNDAYNREDSRPENLTDIDDGANLTVQNVSKKV